MSTVQIQPGQPGYKPNGFGIPEIATAYQNDPRTKLAQSMVEAGSSTAPVAAGGWAWADGIARALSGVAGAYMSKKQRTKFMRDQEDTRQV